MEQDEKHTQTALTSKHSLKPRHFFFSYDIQNRYERIAIFRFIDYVKNILEKDMIERSIAKGKELPNDLPSNYEQQEVETLLHEIENMFRTAAEPQKDRILLEQASSLIHQVEELKRHKIELVERIIKEKKNQGVQVFDWILSNLNTKSSHITFATEEGYVDREYRDSYYLHYSEEHTDFSRYCRRLLLFEGEECKEILEKDTGDFQTLQNNFIGSIIIRPLRDHSIGRVLLNPTFFKSLNGAYVRQAEYTLSYYGIELKINAFPFRMQDRTTTACAESTVLNIFDYFSKKYVDYRFLLPSDIYRIEKSRKEDRVLPTRGINFELVTRILYESGFSPKRYTCIDDASIKAIAKEIGDSTSEEKKECDIVYKKSPIEWMDYYIESGLPVAVGVNQTTQYTGHSILCIGHGKCDKISDDTEVQEYPQKSASPLYYYIDAAQTHSSYVFQDDLAGPYRVYEVKTVESSQKVLMFNNNVAASVGCIVVPLYRRMFLDAAMALSTVHKRLKILVIDSKLDKIGTTRDNPIVFRLFLASSRHYKEERISCCKDNPELKRIYREVPLPNFIWVCELYTKQNKNECHEIYGEIIIDATTTDSDTDSCLLTILPNHAEFRDHTQNSFTRLISQYTIAPYQKNLSSCHRESSSTIQ